MVKVRDDDGVVKAPAHDEFVKAEHSSLADDQKSANENLTLMVIRSQELADEAEEARSKLEISERELRSEGDFRERLIGIVSHDLRNPLGAILMMVQMLLRDPNQDETGRQLVQRIYRSGERMREMVVQLLDFTKAQSGAGLPVDFKATNLEKVTRQVIEELEVRHSMAGRFHCAFEGDLNGSWDADRLGQVISNLGGNAIHHGALDAPINIRIRDEGETVLFEIANQGEPISDALRPFIFGPSLPLKNLKSSKSDGLGLGLHISSEIVRSHGGSIAVHSTAAEGTTFSVRLPRHPGGLKES